MEKGFEDFDFGEGDDLDFTTARNNTLFFLEHISKEEDITDEEKSLLDPYIRYLHRMDASILNTMHDEETLKRIITNLERFLSIIQSKLQDPQYQTFEVKKLIKKVQSAIWFAEACRSRMRGEKPVRITEIARRYSSEYITKKKKRKNKRE